MLRKGLGKSKTDLHGMRSNSNLVLSQSFYFDRIAHLYAFMSNNKSSCFIVAWTTETLQTRINRVPASCPLHFDCLFFKKVMYIVHILLLKIASCWVQMSKDNIKVINKGSSRFCRNPEARL